MKKALYIILILSIAPLFAIGQYTISEKANVTSRIDTSKLVIYDNINIKANTEAYSRFLKRKRRHERNFVETINALYITQYAYNNWDKGGENSFNGKFTTRSQYIYHVDKLAIDTYFNASYGMSRADTITTKTEDKFEINSDISYVLYKRWNYTFGINLASQFTRTYTNTNSRDEYRSSFFAPANIKPYFGFTYKVSDSQKVTFAPLSGNVLLVLDDSLSAKGAFGIDKGKKAKLSVGAYLNCQWSYDITRNGLLKYKTIIQCFSDYKTAPNVNWESWLDFTVFKFFSINLYVNLIYDNKIIVQKKVIGDNGTEEFVNSPSRFQLKQTLGFGIAYNFRNKNKPSYNKEKKII